MNVSADADLFFLDTIGELSKFYGFCDICFVGGSIVPYGGHNILEPLAYNKPVIFGSNMRNFQDIAEAALSSGAGISVEDEATLYEAIECLLTDSLRYTQLCENARKVFEKGAESSKKNLELIKSVI
jgi:3-deoxy-D-manno-octulosonic-acid transferase